MVDGGVVHGTRGPRDLMKTGLRYVVSYQVNFTYTLVVTCTVLNANCGALRVHSSEKGRWLFFLYARHTKANERSRPS